MIRHFVPRPVWIGDDDVQGGTQERKVVVAAVPHDDVRLALCLADYLLVINAGVHDGTGRDMGFVFLAFLDGDIVPVEILEGAEALHALPRQIPVRHGVADHRDPPAQGLQDTGHASRRLGLARPCAYRADADDRHAGHEHRRGGTQQHKTCAGRHGNGSHVHDMFVRDVAVGEDDLVGAQPADKLSKLLFRVNGNPGWIQRACEDGRVQPSLQVGNLRGGKGDYLVLGAPAKVDVEVMKIAAAGAEDDHPGAGPRPSTTRDPADVPRAALTSSDLRHRRHRTARLPAGIPAHHFCAASAKPLNLSLRGPRGAEAISSHGDRHAPSALAMTNLLDLRRRRGSGFDEPACAHVTGRVVRFVQR